MIVRILRDSWSSIVKFAERILEKNLKSPPSFGLKNNSKGPETLTISHTVKIQETGYKKQSSSLNFSNRTITLLRPVDKHIEISSPFGYRQPIGGSSENEEFHNGIDFKTPENTRVYAVDSGSAFRIGWENKSNHKQGFGRRIMQEIEVEGERFYITYAHLNAILVVEGSRIKIGDHIAFTGNTGRSTGPHLHIGVRMKDTGDWWNIKFI
jgi:murein DD-endopeptidase MepM/ murein hydrolase activator NlpD